MLDLNKIAEKWQKRWKKEKAFEAEIDPKRKKFFINAPYPYVNGYLHIGHFYTYAIAEATARYKRLRGYNVLFPQGWHCTGSPIVSAAKRVEENEPKQIQILRSMGFTEIEIKKFKEPKHWIEVFIPAAEQDFLNQGLSIDPRRSFFTTSLNPCYNKFVEWQFNRLKKGNYIEKGKHPVVWDPKNNTPVGDHDRIEGEGETPQEFTILKFKHGNEYITAATLRPETVFGQTNLWVGADIKYVKAKINGKETWIVSKECAEKLTNQDRKANIIGEVLGPELIGDY